MTFHCERSVDFRLVRGDHQSIVGQNDWDLNLPDTSLEHRSGLELLLKQASDIVANFMAGASNRSFSNCFRRRVAATETRHSSEGSLARLRPRVQRSILDLQLPDTIRLAYKRSFIRSEIEVAALLA